MLQTESEVFKDNNKYCCLYVKERKFEIKIYKEIESEGKTFYFFMTTTVSLDTLKLLNNNDKKGVLKDDVKFIYKN
jgi:hypothetical protein